MCNFPIGCGLSLELIKYLLKSFGARDDVTLLGRDLVAFASNIGKLSTQD